MALPDFIWTRQDRNEGRDPEPFTEFTFDVIRSLVERLLSQGWGPLNIAGFFNDVRSGKVKLNSPPPKPRTLSRFDVMEDFE